MLTLIFLACTEPYRGDIDNAEIYAVGDSVLDWNVGEGSVPEVVGETLDRPTYNAAIGGSHFLDDEEQEGIPAQYEDGEWQWLLMDGGANDLNDRCGCSDCDDVLDSIISADGTQGAMADFATSVADSGVQVLIMGYYRIPEDAPDFEGCNAIIPELSQRQASLAALHDGITFADASSVLDGEDLAMYDEDMIHPSLQGCQTLGTFLAEAIQSAE